VLSLYSHCFICPVLQLCPISHRYHDLTDAIGCRVSSVAEHWLDEVNRTLHRLESDLNEDDLLRGMTGNAEALANRLSDQRASHADMLSRSVYDQLLLSVVVFFIFSRFLLSTFLG